ncbi:hypothetical protein BGX28_003656 [Mortierella sp. GBA30]|nr:hypothetical protein BGX28_003656 [Mortierella sp. GBA30]
MASTRIILENVFGMLGIIFWSFQLLPQVIDNYKAKSTEVQPQIFGALSAVCYCQCLLYGMRWSLRRTVVASCFMFVAMAGIEVAAVYGTRAGMDRQVKGTIEAAGIIPILLLALGFMPQYVDIYRVKSVVGVSMAFIAADAMGAVFSLISLAFRTELDLLATLNYVVVLVCDLLVVAFYVYYNKLNRSVAGGKQVDSAELEPENAVDEQDSAVVTIVEQDATPAPFKQGA